MGKFNNKKRIYTAAVRRSNNLTKKTSASFMNLNKQVGSSRPTNLFLNSNTLQMSGKLSDKINNEYNINCNESPLDNVRERVKNDI